MEGTSNPPSLEEIRNTRHWAFQIEAGTAELQEAIGKQIQRLSAEFPEWKFSAWFQSIARRGNSPLIYLLAPEIVGRHRSKYLRIPRPVALAFGRSRR